jgi:hypothetical protein
MVAQQDVLLVIDLAGDRVLGCMHFVRSILWHLLYLNFAGIACAAGCSAGCTANARLL